MVTSIIPTGRVNLLFIFLNSVPWGIVVIVIGKFNKAEQNLLEPDWQLFNFLSVFVEGFGNLFPIIPMGFLF